MMPTNARIGHKATAGPCGSERMMANSARMMAANRKSKESEAVLGRSSMIRATAIA
jgi:hypothetical protein